MEYQIGDRVMDWDGAVGVVTATRMIDPLRFRPCPPTRHTLKPYQRIEVVYNPPVTVHSQTSDYERSYSEGASANYRPA